MVTAVRQPDLNCTLFACNYAAPVNQIAGTSGNILCGGSITGFLNTEENAAPYYTEIFKLRQNGFFHLYSPSYPTITAQNNNDLSLQAMFGEDYVANFSATQSNGATFFAGSVFSRFQNNKSITQNFLNSTTGLIDASSTGNYNGSSALGIFVDPENNYVSTMYGDIYKEKFYSQSLQSGAVTPIIPENALPPFTYAECASINYNMLSLGSNIPTTPEPAAIVGINTGIVSPLSLSDSNDQSQLAAYNTSQLVVCFGAFGFYLGKQAILMDQNGTNYWHVNFNAGDEFSQNVLSATTGGSSWHVNKYGELVFLGDNCFFLNQGSYFLTPLYGVIEYPPQPSISFPGVSTQMKTCCPTGQARQ